MAYSFNPFTNTLDIVGTGTTGVASGLSQYKARQATTPAPNGVLVTFSVSDTYQPGSLTVYLNGVQEHSVTEVAPNQFTLTEAPFTGETMLASYAIAATSTTGPTSGLYLEEGSTWLMLEDDTYILQEA